MIFDFDDHSPENDAMPYMWELKAVNPQFRVTLFTIPGLCDAEWLERHPRWVELQPHGWLHPDPMECADWTYDRMMRLLGEPIMEHFPLNLGWKSPGWQTSDGVYEALLECDVWIADQPYNNERRPPELRCHLLGSPDHWHGHVSDVEGNGIRETWPALVQAVREAPFFEFMSQAVDRASVG